MKNFATSGNEKCGLIIKKKGVVILLTNKQKVLKLPLRRRMDLAKWMGKFDEAKQIHTKFLKNLV